MQRVVQVIACMSDCKEFNTHVIYYNWYSFLLRFFFSDGEVVYLRELEPNSRTNSQRAKFLSIQTSLVTWKCLSISYFLFLMCDAFPTLVHLFSFLVFKSLRLVFCVARVAQWIYRAQHSLEVQIQALSVPRARFCSKRRRMMADSVIALWPRLPYSCAKKECCCAVLLYTCYNEGSDRGFDSVRRSRPGRVAPVRANSSRQCVILLLFFDPD